MGSFGSPNLFKEETMFSLIVEYFQNLFRYNKTVEELSKLTDKELKDLGIYRCNIPFVAAESLMKKF